METLDDSLYTILSRLPLIEKIRFREVNKRWLQTLDHLIRQQRTLGDKQSSPSSFCNDTISANDLVSYKIFTNKEKLSKILTFCPNIEVIHLMIIRGPNNRRRNAAIMADLREEIEAVAIGPEQVNTSRGSLETNFMTVDLVSDHCPKLKCVKFTYFYPFTGHVMSDLQKGLNDSYVKLSEKCPMLEHISLPFMKEETLEKIIADHPNIGALSLANTSSSVPRKSLAGLGPLLQVFEIEVLDTISSKHVSESKAAPSLKNVSFRFSDSQVLADICSSCRNITSLDLIVTSDRVDMKKFSAIRRLTSLQILQVYMRCSREVFRSTNVSSIFSDIFTRTNRLQKITLYSFILDDELFSNLNMCQELTSVTFESPYRMDERSLTSYALESLAQLPRLTNVRIRTWTPSKFKHDAFAILLTGCRNLTSISLSKCLSLISSELMTTLANYLVTNRNLDVDIEDEDGGRIRKNFSTSSNT